MFDDMHKGSGCLRCPADEFECDAQYRSSRCAALRAKIGADFDPKTNADRIRAMSDKKLAEWLTTFAVEAFAAGVIGMGEAMMDAEDRLVWLQQPAEEETT